MSFIYNDEKLIAELVKSGLDWQYRFSKIGQDATQQDKVSAALKLLDNLERSASPDEPVISSATDDAKLFSYHVENLGALLNFVIQNGITVGYKPIAVSNNPNDPSYVFYKLETNAGFAERADRARATTGFYVNKDLLVQYIQSLQKIAHDSGNEVMRVQLGSLIDQANNQLGTKIDPNYKPKEKPGEPETPEQKPGQPGQISSATFAIIKDMASNLPLQAESLDFTRIRYFCNKFKELLKSSKHAEAPAIMTNISNLEKAMSNASQMTASKGDLRISMSGTWQDIKNQLASTVAGAVTRSYRPFLDNLSYIVTTTGALVDSLYAMYRNVFDRPDFSDVLSEIKQQSMNGGSYKVQNEEIIDSWKDATPQVVQLKT